MGTLPSNGWTLGAITNALIGLIQHPIDGEVSVADFEALIDRLIVIRDAMDLGPEQLVSECQAMGSRFPDHNLPSITLCQLRSEGRGSGVSDELYSNHAELLRSRLPDAPTGHACCAELALRDNDLSTAAKMMGTAKKLAESAGPAQVAEMPLAGLVTSSRLASRGSSKRDRVLAAAAADRALERIAVLSKRTGRGERWSQLSVDLNLIKGLALCQMSDFKSRAELAFNEVLELTAGEPAAIVGLAEVALLDGLITRAVEFLSQVCWGMGMHSFKPAPNLDYV